MEANNFQTMTVYQLKQACIKRGLEHTGRKTDLVERLEACDAAGDKDEEADEVEYEVGEEGEGDEEVEYVEEEEENGVAEEADEVEFEDVNNGDEETYEGVVAEEDEPEEEEEEEVHEEPPPPPPVVETKPSPKKLTKSVLTIKKEIKTEVATPRPGIGVVKAVPGKSPKPVLKKFESKTPAKKATLGAKVAAKPSETEEQKTARLKQEELEARKLGCGKFTHPPKLELHTELRDQHMMRRILIGPLDVGAMLENPLRDWISECEYTRYNVQRTNENIHKFWTEMKFDNSSRALAAIEEVKAKYPDVKAFTAYTLAKGKSINYKALVSGTFDIKAGSSDALNNAKHVVFVDNLPSLVTSEDQLKEIFPQADDIMLSRNNQDQPRGCAYLLFETHAKMEATLKACKESPCQLFDQVLYVSEYISGKVEFTGKPSAELEALYAKTVSEGQKMQTKERSELVHKIRQVESRLGVKPKMLQWGGRSTTASSVSASNTSFKTTTTKSTAKPFKPNTTVSAGPRKPFVHHRPMTSGPRPALGGVRPQFAGRGAVRPAMRPPSLFSLPNRPTMQGPRPVLMAQQQQRMQQVEMMRRQNMMREASMRQDTDGLLPMPSSRLMARPRHQDDEESSSTVSLLMGLTKMLDKFSKKRSDPEMMGAMDDFHEEPRLGASALLQEEQMRRMMLKRRMEDEYQLPEPKRMLPGYRY